MLIRLDERLSNCGSGLAEVHSTMGTVATHKIPTLADFTTVGAYFS